MKKIGKIMGLLLVTLLFSGCMKYDIDMTINSDKSMDFKFITAYSKQLLAYASEDGGETSILNESDLDAVKKEGYEVSKYNDDTFEGFEIKKHFASIDEVSSEEDVSADLSMEKSSDKLFKVTKGFFKDTYKATFKFSEAKEYSAQSEAYQDSDEYSSLLSGMEMKFTLNLPNKAVSNNATTVLSDGKKLEWDLLSFDKDAIEFEFEVVNTSNVLLVVIPVIVVVAAIVAVVIVMNKKNKKEA